MSTRRRYTAKERAAAVGLATVDGVTQAEAKTGIPKTTIQYWIDKPEFAQLRTKSRDAVADEFWTVIQVGLRRIADLIPASDDLQKVSVATGILYDKHALLMGMATSRSESRDLTGTMPDADLIAAVDEADAITSAHRAETEAPEPSEV